MSYPEFEHVSTLSSAISYAAFLGSSTRACVIGPIPSDKYKHESRIDIIDLNEKSFYMATCPLMGRTTAVELCGFAHTAKLFIACATYSSDGSKNQFFIEVTEGSCNEISLSPVMLQRNIADQPIDDNLNSLITSMAFSSSQGILASASETGVVEIFDINRQEVWTLSCICLSVHRF